MRGRADKIWVVSDHGIALTDLLTLPSLPRSVAAARDHFERTGMDRVGLIAMDFTYQTVNLYSPVFAPGTISETAIRAMLTGLGFAGPGPEEMRLNAEAFDFYQTFSWDEPGIRRLCLCYPMRLTAQLSSAGIARARARQWPFSEIGKWPLTCMHTVGVAGFEPTTSSSRTAKRMNSEVQF